MKSECLEVHVGVFREAELAKLLADVLGSVEQIQAPGHAQPAPLEVHLQQLAAGFVQFSVSVRRMRRQ